MRKHTYFFLAILIQIVAIACVVSAAAERAFDTEQVKISKISFLFHPVCWDCQLTPNGKPSFAYISTVADMRGGSWYDEQEFLEILAWERNVNRKQREYIEKMGPNEALVIYPIGNSKAMRDLEQFAQNHLRRRCIIVHSKPPSKKKGRDYRNLLSSPIKVKLCEELLEAVQENGYDWSATALKVLFHSQMLSLEIEKELSIRALHIDPEGVVAVAFGEGFEQCAMTWKAMLPYFLGLANPIENDFELSVSGMPLLRSASFKGRVALSQDVRLFLWEVKDGRPMALFTRAQARLSDPQLFVSLPFEPENLKIYGTNGNLLWPQKQEEHWAVKAEMVGPVKVPVFTALRQMYTDQAAYVVVTGVSFAEFYSKLLAAPIAPAGQ